LQSSRRGPPRSPAWLARFVYSTNHKDIGTMYWCLRLMGGLIGGTLSIGMRSRADAPWLQFFHDSHTFNVFTTAHGLIMIFFMVIAGDDRRFGNWMGRS